jgi:hypothetical protein
LFVESVHVDSHGMERSQCVFEVNIIWQQGDGTVGLDLDEPIVVFLPRPLVGNTT